MKKKPPYAPPTEVHAYATWNDDWIVTVKFDDDCEERAKGVSVRDGMKHAMKAHRRKEQNP